MSIDPTKLPNVLVVEDEMILRMRAVDIVEDAGFNPVEGYYLPTFKCLAA